MAAEPFTPYTRILEPDITGLPRQYVSEREVAAETDPPARGAVLGNIWGTAHAANFVVSAAVLPRNGKRILTVVHCTPGAWVLLYGSERSRELRASVGYSQQIVPTPSQGETVSDPFVEYTPINEALSFRRTTIVPTAALNAYYDTSPIRINIPDLPRELVSVTVVWNSQYSVGTQEFDFFKTATGDSWSLSGSADDQASSSAAITPEIQLKFKDVASSNLPGTLHEFYLLPPVTEAAILSRVGAIPWPVFKPESVTITSVGQSIRVSVSVQATLSGSVEDDEVVASGWSKGSSDDFSVGLSQNSIQIPACIHGAITFAGETSKSQFVAATGVISMSHSLVGSVAVTKTKSGTAFGYVTPTSLGAVEGATTIPTSGLYLIDSDTSRPNEWGYVLVSAKVFNAASLA